MFIVQALDIDGVNWVSLGRFTSFNEFKRSFLRNGKGKFRSIRERSDRFYSYWSV